MRAQNIEGTYTNSFCKLQLNKDHTYVKTIGNTEYYGTWNIERKFLDLNPSINDHPRTWMKIKPNKLVQVNRRVYKKFKSKYGQNFEDDFISCGSFKRE